MRIAIIGSTGRAGSHILKEALRRGHDVTAIARNIEKIGDHPSVNPVSLDAEESEVLVEAIKGHDIVIISVQFNLTDGKKILEAVRKSGIRRVAVVGGGGSLEVAPGRMLMNEPNMPPDRLPASLANYEILQMLLRDDILEWTYISPSLIFFEGEAQGGFRYGKDELLRDKDGKSSISMGDYAVAMLDEIENPKFLRERFTIGY